MEKLYNSAFNNIITVNKLHPTKLLPIYGEFAILFLFIPSRNLFKFDAFMHNIYEESSEWREKYVITRNNIFCMSLLILLTVEKLKSAGNVLRT